MQQQSHDVQFLKDRLVEKDQQLERIETKHNTQVVEFIDEISKGREERSRLAVAVAAKDSKLKEAAGIIAELQREIVERQVAKEAAEAEEEIRRRARCDRPVQCALLTEPVAPPAIDPSRPQPKIQSSFLALAQRERERGMRSATTTAISQTDPVVVWGIGEGERGSLTQPSVAIPTLQLGCALTPEAAICLTSRLATDRSGAEPLTVREMEDRLLVHNGELVTSGDVDSGRLESTLRGEDRMASPGVESEYIRPPREESLSLRRASHSPGWALVHMGEEVLAEEGRVFCDEELEDQPVEIHAVIKPAASRTVGVNTDAPTFVGTPCQPVCSPSNSTEAGVSAFALLRTHAFTGADAIVERLTLAMERVKGGLDEDGHFAAIFVTGLLASIMFAR